MRRVIGLGTCLLAWSAAAMTQPSRIVAWENLVQQGKCKEARALCEPWISAPEIGRKVEGRKCMSNVVLCESRRGMALTGNDEHGGELRSGFAPQAVDEALTLLNEALKLAPQDVSIHKGRLHLLEISSRFTDMAAALDESCRLYKSRRGSDEWLDYTVELYKDGQFRAGLRLLGVLEKHYPDSHEVLGNTAAMHMALGEFDQAITYLQRALRIAPDDPIDLWNLARTYDISGKTAEAELWYPKAISLDPDEARRKNNTCLYAGFIEKKLLDPARACSLEKNNCPANEQSACAAVK